jgi:hypothetical protein
MLRLFYSNWKNCRLLGLARGILRCRANCEAELKGENMRVDLINMSVV